MYETSRMYFFLLSFKCFKKSFILQLIGDSFSEEEKEEEE